MSLPNRCFCPLRVSAPPAPRSPQSHASASPTFSSRNRSVLRPITTPPARRTLARLHLRRIHALGWGGAARHHQLPSVRAPHARLLSRRAHRPPPRRAPDPSSPAAARRGPVPISYAPLQLRPPHRGVPLGSATGSNASAVPLGFHRGRRAPRTRAACLSAAPRSPETRLTRLPCLLCAGAVPNLRTAQAAPLLRLTARQDLLRLETFAVGSTSGEHYVIPHEVHPCVCKIVSP